MTAGTLYLVSTPIGNPEDLTRRALRVLREVTLIAAENPETTQALLAPHRIATPLTSYHYNNKEEKAAVLLSRLREGQSMALVCDAGTPTVEDPGCYLITRAIRAGIRVTPVPGASVPLAALVTTGWSGDRFTFAGTWPAHPIAQRRLLKELAGSPYPIILFVETQGLDSTLEALLKTLGNRPAVLGIDLTMPTERVDRGTIRRLLTQRRTAPLRGNMVLILKGGRGRKRTGRHATTTT